MKKKISIGLAVIAIVYGGIQWYRASTKSAPEFTAVTAVRGHLDQKVEVSGSVTAATDANLNFEIAGTIVQLPVKVNDRVRQGALIARLNSENADAAVSEADGGLKQARANLAQMQTGASDEVINQYRVDVQKAQADLDKARIDLENARLANSQSLSDAYAAMVSTLQGSIQPLDASVNDIDGVVGVLNTIAAQTYQKAIMDLDNRTIYVSVAKNDFASARDAISRAKSAIAPLTAQSDAAAIDAAESLMKNALSAISVTLNDTWTVLDKMDLTASGLTVSVVNASKTVIDTDRSSVNSKLSSVLLQEQKVSSAKLNFGSTASTQSASAVAQAEANVKIYASALSSAQAALAAKVAKPRAVDLAPLEAAAAEAQAAYQNAIANRDKAFLRAPFAGTITKVNYQLGEQASPATPVAQIFADNEFRKIEVNVSEADITKVRMAQKAQVTFDALGSDQSFTAEVTDIDPAETTISDVVYYKVTLMLMSRVQGNGAGEEALTQSDMVAIKPGMTANVTIFTASKDNVLMVPERAVLEKGGVPYVRVVTNEQKGAFEDRKVSTGLRGGDAMIEIIGGVEDGARVITFLKGQ